jgi:hypothetical protein
LWRSSSETLDRWAVCIPSRGVALDTSVTPAGVRRSDQYVEGVPASLAEAGYDLSLKAVEEQESRLADLRSRTGTLPAAASLAASFLGGQSIRTGELRFLGVLAIVAYVACVAACIKVLLPHRLVFSFRGSVLVRAAREAAVERSRRP